MNSGIKLVVFFCATLFFAGCGGESDSTDLQSEKEKEEIREIERRYDDIMEKDREALPEMRNTLQRSIDLYDAKNPPVEPEPVKTAFEKYKKRFRPHFTGETLITVRDPSTSIVRQVPISSVCSGDQVVSDKIGTSDGNREFSSVEEITEKTVHRLIRLTFGEKQLRVTENSSFYIVDRKDRVEAWDLQIGDRLLDFSGEPVTLDNIQTEEGEFKVYDLDMKENHYYANSVLVG